MYAKADSGPTDGGYAVIIFRYLARDLVAATAAVAAVLLVVIVSGRFVRLLADAAAGFIDPGILFAVIGYRLPGFLELILPLAFFLGILLAYGRFYVDSEMTVLRACGMGEGRLLAYTLVVAVAVAALAGWLSLVVGPDGIARAQALLDTQKGRGEFEIIEGGSFYPLREGRGVAYTESKDTEGVLYGVFLAETGSGKGARAPVIVVAERGRARRAADGGDFMVLDNGYRIQGIPGRADFQLTAFAEYGQRLSVPAKIDRRRTKIAALPTGELTDWRDPQQMSALQWRLSVPLVVLVVTLMAVPLSQTSSRRGRYTKVFPAMLLYVIYLLALNAARGAVEDGELPGAIGLWPVHLAFVAIAGGLLAWNAGRRPFRRAS